MSKNKTKKFLLLQEFFYSCLCTQEIIHYFFCGDRGNGASNKFFVK